MVAFLFGNIAHHQEDLLPVLKGHRHEVCFVNSFEDIQKRLGQRLSALIFILHFDSKCLDLCRKIQKSKFKNYLTIIAYLDHLSNENYAKAIDAGLDELIIAPCDQEELEVRVKIAENHSNKKKKRLKYQQKIKESNLRQNSISKLGMAALSIIDMDDFINRVLKELVRVLHVKYSEFLELLSDKESFLLRNGTGWKSEYMIMYKIKNTDMIQSGFTIRTGIPVVVRDYSKEARFIKSDLLTEHHIQSGISVSIPGINKSHGVLGIFSDKPELFTDDDIHYVEAVSNLLGQAMERFETQQSLKESEERFVGALRKSPVVLFIQDKELRYKWIFNPHIGFTKEMLIGKTDLELFSEKEAGQFIQIKREVLETGRPLHREMWVTRDSKKYCYDVTILPLRDINGNIDGITASSIDITDFKKTEQALRESESRFHSSFDNAPIGMAIIGSDGHLRDVNDALCDILGYTEDELLSMTFKDLDYPRDAAQEMEYIRKMLIGEISTYQIEKRYIHKTGKVIWTLLSSSVVKDENGGIRYFIGQILDITQRKEIEDQLKKSENRFSKAFSSAPNPIAISRMRDGYFYDVNESFMRFSGYSRDEVVGATSIELKIWENREKRQGLIREIDKQGFIQNYEMQFRTKSGSCKDTLLSIDVIELEGEMCLLTMISDVTERKITEQRLRESEARYRAILETIVDAIITFDVSGEIETFNKAALKMFGYTSDEVIGKNINMFLPQLSDRMIPEYVRFNSAPNSQTTFDEVMETQGLRKDGSVFFADFTVSKVTLQGRAFFTAIVRDITERRTMEQEILQISEQERRRIGQDLHDGLGQMLSGIRLISQSLARKLKANALPGSNEVQEIAELIKESDQYARNLARGLVPIELETNGITTALEKLSLNAERLFGIKCQFEKNGRIHIEDDMTALHLYRIAQEAISNAVKHGKADEIIITISEEQDCIILRVNDNGFGFREQREKDVGMGLRIMKYRARMINGTLDIKSAPDNITEVICSVPLTLDT